MRFNNYGDTVISYKEVALFADAVSDDFLIFEYMRYLDSMKIVVRYNEACANKLEKNVPGGMR